VRLVLIACILVGGCAVLEFPNPKTKSEGGPLGPAEIRSAQAAAGTIAVGRSTKADVRAALGEAIVVDFESGYEVWVYRERLGERAKPPATELVLLFEPSGILTKRRIR
jgi:hypothetical protein